MEEFYPSGFEAALTSPIPLTPSCLDPGFDPPRFLAVLACCVSVTCTFLLFLLIGRKIVCLGPCTFMFVSLNVADMITAGGYLVGVLGVYLDYEEPLPNARCNSTLMCVSQSFVTTWASMASFMWTITIEIACFLIIWRSQRLHVSTRWKVFLSITCWGFPFSITMLALASNVLGFDSSRTSAGWCWIVSCPTASNSSDDYIETGSHLLWMLIAGKLWEILAYLTISNLIFLQLFRYYRRRVLFLRQFDFDEEDQLMSNQDSFQRSLSVEEEMGQIRECKLLFWIPVAMITVRIWGTLRFGILSTVLLSHNFSTYKWTRHLNAAFLYLQGIGDGSQGTCNFILVLLFQRRRMQMVSHVIRRR